MAQQGSFHKKLLLNPSNSAVLVCSAFLLQVSTQLIATGYKHKKVPYIPSTKIQVVSWIHMISAQSQNTHSSWRVNTVALVFQKRFDLLVATENISLWTVLNKKNMNLLTILEAEDSILIIVFCEWPRKVRTLKIIFLANQENSLK